jgi:hypothetical protein
VSRECNRVAAEPRIARETTRGSDNERMAITFGRPYFRQTRMQHMGRSGTRVRLHDDPSEAELARGLYEEG